MRSGSSLYVDSAVLELARLRRELEWAQQREQAALEREIAARIREDCLHKELTASMQHISAILHVVVSNCFQ